jgi:hypothetical protein
MDRTNQIPSVAYIASEAIGRQESANPQLRRRMLGYVVAHELGHLIGLPHDNDRGIMHRNTQWLPNVNWTPRERSALAALLTTAPLVAARLNHDEQ